MLMILRVVAALMAGTVVGLFFVGIWPLFWFVWGTILGLVIVRWWGIAFALAAFPPTWFINSVLGTRGEGQEWGVAQEVLWPLLATASAAVGIAAGVAVTIALIHLTRRRARARA